MMIKKFDYYPVHSNTVGFDFNGFKIYFSYDTAIAFECDGELFVSAEKYSNTTSKHQNSLEPDKTKRIPQEKFEELFYEKFKKHITR